MPSTAEVLALIDLIRRYGPVVVEAYKLLRRGYDIVRDQDGITDQQRAELEAILATDPRDL